MFCAAAIGDKVERGPVTGPTRRLAEPSPLPTAPRTPPTRSHKRRRHRHNNVGMPLFLIGLGLLFATKMFWPGILLLLGVVALANAGQLGRRDGLQGLVFFGGLALLFATGWWWPGLLLWGGALSWIGSQHGGRWRCW